MRFVRGVFNLGYIGVILLFVCAGFSLLFFAASEIWMGVAPNTEVSIRQRLSALLEGVGLITIAIVTFELGQTILEEELLRQAHISTPTRVRRFLSRFMVVVVVALSIESLVAIFDLVHSDITRLPQAASVAIAAATLLLAWGAFIRWNTAAEKLEPEAMEDAKAEDDKLDAEHEGKP